MFKHILLATDGSPACDQAARVAIGLARTHDAGLTAVYVIDPFPYLGMGQTNPMGFQAYISAAHSHAGRALARVAELCDDGGEPTPLETRIVEEATAAHGIAQTAHDEGADLIVMASHGHGALRKIVLGSVTTRVLAEATVPVLVVR
ncbi:MAG: UspA domain protein [Ramlibacter sp.]|jgi:nucleotide-binding universal stress UspA family protein|uniref:universal stress protein n=1 Tax=Ramlibacter sp. TaxID=1917967 RepID=UPI00262005A2|nr:universal stress protein [Ramlibacter sp.]MDB5750697.1 UspA domain protein [Ramlibacter sp.]